MPTIRTSSKASAPALIAADVARRLADLNEDLPTTELPPPQVRVVAPLTFVSMAADEGSIAVDADTTELRACTAIPQVRTVRAHAEAEREPAVREIAVGTILRSRYVIEQIIGRGGDSIVFRAADLQRTTPEDRARGPIAIKALLPEQRRNPNALARLKRAFQQMRSLNHPGIARVFDLDSDGEIPFMTMELVDGQPLNARMAGLSLQQGVKLIGECCEALEHAHALGIVHGDLKPSNVLVTHDGKVKLIDFGSAPGSGDRVDAGSELSLAATANYASPQVLDGKIAEARDDVFSLACLSYVILSRGSHPFGRNAATDASCARVYPESVPGIPERLSKVLMRGLAPERELRTPSVQVFREEVTDDNRGAAPVPPIPSPVAKPADKPADKPTVRAGSIEVTAQPYRFVAATTPARPALQAPKSLAVSAPRVAITSRTKIYVALVGLLATLLVVAVLQRQTVQTQSTLTPNPLHSGPVRARELPVTAAAPSVPVEPVPSPPTAAPAATAAEQAAVPAAAPQPRASGVISFDSSAMSASPEQVLIAIPLKRLQSTRGRGLVAWRVEGGTAQPGVDYEPVEGRIIRFIEGQTARSLFIPLVKRNPAAPPRGLRTLVVALEQAAGGSALGPVTRVTVTIDR